MSTVIVDGTNAAQPYVAVPGRTFTETYLPLRAWKALESKSLGHSFGELLTGAQAKFWKFASREDAAKALKAVIANVTGARIAKHDDLAKVYEIDGTLVTVGVTKVAIVDQSEQVARIKWAQTLGLIDDSSLIECAGAVAVYWGKHDVVPISRATLRNLAKKKDKVTVTIRRRGWMLDLTASDSCGGMLVAALTDMYPVLFRATIAELPELIELARSKAIDIVADFDVTKPWGGGESLARSCEVPGWDKPTTSGRKLFTYQRDGIAFVASRRGRAIIADDMGLGKTAQAIGYSRLIGAEKTVVVCPAALRNVWESEIVMWDAGTIDAIQVCRMGQDAEYIRPGTKWVVTSYDLISDRVQVWRESDEAGFNALIQYLSACKHQEDDWISADNLRREVRISGFDPALQNAPIRPSRTDEWCALIRELKNPSLTALIDWKPNLVLLDEIHNVKSPAARRTAAAKTLSASAEHVVGLTGTPLLNRPAEATNIVRVLHPSGYQELRANDISVARCRALLEPVTLRRLKDDVLRELPPLTEQVIHLEGAMVVPNVELLRWNEPQEQVPKWAVDLGKNLQYFARHVPRNLASFEAMREKLGNDKANRDDVVTLVKDAIRTTGNVVAFVAHHKAADSLAFRMQSEGIKRVVVADGRTSTTSRAQIVEQFQAGKIDCLIASIRAMGEGITLTAASTVIFVEIAWNPKEHAQARDRLRRVGQTRPVHAIYLVAPHAVDHCMSAMTLYKAAIISAVHVESVAVLGSVVFSEAP